MAKTYTARPEVTCTRTRFRYYKKDCKLLCFWKNMFKLSNTGEVALQAEIEKIKSIALLKEYTKFTLAQIKTIINTNLMKR